MIWRYTIKPAGMMPEPSDDHRLVLMARPFEGSRDGLCAWVEVGDVVAYDWQLDHRRATAMVLLLLRRLIRKHPMFYWARLKESADELPRGWKTTRRAWLYAEWMPCGPLDEFITRMPAQTAGQLYQ